MTTDNKTRGSEMGGQKKRVLVGLIGALLVAAGCGSTHSDAELRQALAVPIGTSSDAPAGADRRRIGGGSRP